MNKIFSLFFFIFLLSNCSFNKNSSFWSQSKKIISEDNPNKIIKFDGCYHGHVDSLLIKAGSGVTTFGLPDSPGIPKELAKQTLSCEFNNKDEFLKIFNKVKKDLAAVIIEPIAGNMGFIPADKSFLKLIREKTAQNKSINF